MSPLAPNTVRKIHFVVRSVLGLGLRWRHLGISEAEITQPPTFQPHDLDPPSRTKPQRSLATLDLTRKIVSVIRNTDGVAITSTKTHQGRRVALDDANDLAPWSTACGWFWSWSSSSSKPPTPAGARAECVTTPFVDVHAHSGSVALLETVGRLP